MAGCMCGTGHGWKPRAGSTRAEAPRPWPQRGPSAGRAPGRVRVFRVSPWPAGQVHLASQR
eukprot:7830562-Pyramimonas_sp.AAC.1